VNPNIKTDLAIVVATLLLAYPWLWLIDRIFGGNK